MQGQMTVEQLKQCNRNATVYTPPSERPSHKPKLPIYLDIAKAPIGAEGWIASIWSFHGKLYVFGDMSPKMILETDWDTYDGPAFDRKIHIRKVAGGVSIDCRYQAIVISRDSETTNMFIPIVGMFHEDVRKKVE